MSIRQISGLGLVALCALLLAYAAGTLSHQRLDPDIAPVSATSISTQYFGLYRSVELSDATTPRTHVQPADAASDKPQGAISLADTSALPAAALVIHVATTSSALSSVTLSIVDPDGTSTFSVALPAGANACDVLAEAKKEGKLASLTLDNAYLSSFGSAYVREINGFSNDWTFSVGGKEPEGCSLYSPRRGDTIMWKFGAGA